MSYWVEARPELFVMTGGMHENPHGVPRDEILRMYDELGPEMGAQVVFGKYVDLSGLVFTAEILSQMFLPTDVVPRVRGEKYVNVEAAKQSLIAKRLGIYDETRYAHGIDLARKKDYTVITTLDTGPLRSGVSPYASVVYFRRTNRVPWPQIYAEIGRALHLFPGEFLIDETGIGDVIREELENRMYCPTHHAVFEATSACPGARRSPCVKDEIFRFYPNGYVKTTQSKVALVNHLQACLGHGYDSSDLNKPFGLIKAPRIAAMEEEFPQYAWEDKKLQTDTVMSLGLAAMQGLHDFLEDPDFGSPYGG